MPARHWQLEAIRAEVEDNRARAHRLAARVSDEQWTTRPDPTGWSISECLGHLNITSAAMLGPINAALAGSSGGKQPSRYRRDPVGWLLCLTMEPPVRTQFPTTAPFVPEAADSKTVTINEFDAQHDAQSAALERADGHRLGRTKIESPFNAKIRYNLYSAFRLLTAHERRHLWQAERAATAVSSAG